MCCKNSTGQNAPKNVPRHPEFQGRREEILFAEFLCYAKKALGLGIKDVKFSHKKINGLFGVNFIQLTLTSGKRV
jgi:hypothetical protein